MTTQLISDKVGAHLQYTQIHLGLIVVVVSITL